MKTLVGGICTSSHHCCLNCPRGSTGSQSCTSHNGQVEPSPGLVTPPERWGPGDPKVSWKPTCTAVPGACAVLTLPGWRLARQCFAASVSLWGQSVPARLLCPRLENPNVESGKGGWAGIPTCEGRLSLGPLDNVAQGTRRS